MKAACLASLFATGLLVATPAFADACRLEQAATIALKRPQPDALTMNVGIEGRDWIFSLNTGSVPSFIGQTAVTNLHHTDKSLGSVFLLGREFTRGAILPKITLGGLAGDDQGFFIMPDYALAGSTDGQIGLDKLEGYDVELDIAHGKLNLFKKDHCKGQVIYWTNAAAVVPFELQATGQISVPMQLDGQPITVMFDTTIATSRMAVATAHRLFGIHRSDLQLNPQSSAGGEGYDVYRRAFRSLDAGGLAIANPEIDLVDYGDAEAICDGKIHVPQHTRHYPIPYRCYGGADLRLGLKQLGALRLFVAFSEKTLYITPAEAH
jgi:hypothetical protein